MPPNCQFEVEDVLHTWTWPQQFDLIHLRLLLGAFTEAEWKDVYRKCYDALEPGGYIEHVECDVRIMSDDGSVKPDMLLAKWGDQFIECGKKAGRPLDIGESVAEKIRAAGFVDVKETVIKAPSGPWAKDKKLKEAGRVNQQHWNAGFEGWAMFLLTKFGSPEPWTPEEVRAYVEKVKAELKDPRVHPWQWTYVIFLFFLCCG